MKNILTLTLLIIPGVVSSMSVTGYSGVRVTCKYDERYRANQKYFCKGQWSECKDQIKTEEKNKWVASGRFSLYADTRSAVFPVTIGDLKQWDSGKYYCGTERVGMDPSTEVNLKVITALAFVALRFYSNMNNFGNTLCTAAIVFGHPDIKNQHMNLNNGDNKQTSDKQINSEHHKTSY